MATASVCRSCVSMYWRITAMFSWCRETAAGRISALSCRMKARVTSMKTKILPLLLSLLSLLLAACATPPPPEAPTTTVKLVTTVGGMDDLLIYHQTLRRLSQQELGRELQPLAQLLVSNYAEMRRLSDNAEKAGQQAKESQRRMDQLNEKLEALKNIERTLPGQPK